MWWFPAIDAAGVGPAEVAAQPVHHVVVAEAAAEVRDDRLDALGEAPGVGVERASTEQRDDATIFKVTLCDLESALALPKFFLGTLTS